MEFNPGVEAGPNTNYDAGVDFDYSVWDENTVITLVNVRWDSAYRNAVPFADRDALNTFIDNHPTARNLMNNSYAKPFEGVSIDLPHNVAARFNYVRVSNPAMPINQQDYQKDYYYFITGISHESAESTRLTLQLDIFQTYFYDVSFGNCYIERSHLGVAASNNFDSFGRRWLTVAEGLDTGSEYRTIATRKEVVMGLENTTGELGGVDMTSVIIITTQDITAPPGTKEDPNRVTSKGTSFQGIASGASYWAFENQASFRIWMGSISETPWVGESIIAAFMTPKLTRYIDTTSGFAWEEQGTPTDLNSVKLIPLRHFLWENWRQSQEILDAIPAKYQILKKFFTFPYMMIELTTWTGTPIVLKPELWNSTNATVLERVGLIAPGQRLEFHAQRYNSRDNANVENYNNWSDETVDSLGADRERYRDVGDDQGDYWDHATKISNLPSVAIVNDGAISYLASNAHGLAYSVESADWTQAKALRSAQVSYDNTIGSLSSASRITNLANMQNSLLTGNTNRTQAVLTGLNGGMGVVSGALGGGEGLLNVGIGALEALASQSAVAMSSGIEIAARDEATAIQNLTSRQIADQNNWTGSEINDRNKSLADFAAKGDYQNTILGINAKINDSKMIQPTVSGQAGGETINLANNMVQVSARWKMVDEANTQRIGDFWLRYGYALNMIYRPTDLMVMSKFTYWKMVECALVAAPMPEIFKDGLRGIFEKGVTLYADPTDIGTVDLSTNVPKAGITL